MFCKLKVVVDFLRIVVCLLLSRPFGIKVQYTCHKTFKWLMAKGEFDILYLCAGGGGGNDISH